MDNEGIKATAEKWYKKVIKAFYNLFIKPQSSILWIAAINAALCIGLKANILIVICAALLLLLSIVIYVFHYKSLKITTAEESHDRV